jgi:hypothetical protein
MSKVKKIRRKKLSKLTLGNQMLYTAGGKTDTIKPYKKMPS